MMDNYPAGTWGGDPKAPWNQEEPECRECGEEVDDGWNYCPYCGAEIDWGDGDD